MCVSGSYDPRPSWFRLGLWKRKRTRGPAHFATTGGVKDRPDLILRDDFSAAREALGVKIDQMSFVKTLEIVGWGFVGKGCVGAGF